MAVARDPPFGVAADGVTALVSCAQSWAICVLRGHLRGVRSWPLLTRARILADSWCAVLAVASRSGAATGSRNLNGVRADDNYGMSTPGAAHIGILCPGRCGWTQQSVERYRAPAAADRGRPEINGLQIASSSGSACVPASACAVFLTFVGGVHRGGWDDFAAARLLRCRKRGAAASRS